MKKPAQLRAMLVALMPELGRNPDALAMWIEKGRVRSRLAAHGFAWEYQLTVLLKEFAGDPAVPFFAVTEWLREQQPERMAPGGQNGFPFEVDILDDKTFDVQIVLDLDECVAAEPAGAGRWNLSPIAQPVPIDPDGEPLRPAAGPVLSIWHDGEQLAPRPDPAP